MCDICQGKSYQESIARLSEIIDRCGWAAISVEAPVPWVYTVGLLPALGHPELLIAGVEVETARAVIDVVASLVAEGEDLVGRSRLRIDDLHFDLLGVHGRQLEHGLCDGWHRLHSHDAGRAPLRVLQVVLPETFFCRCHRRSQPRLDQPAPALAQLPTRAARRRHQRTQSRRR